MTPYSATRIANEEQQLFWKIRRMVEGLPDFTLAKDESGKEVELSCHILAIAFEQVIREVKACHGLFGSYYQHSWLTTSNRNIIDVYPAGIIGGPILVHAEHPLTPGKVLYKPARGIFLRNYQIRFSEASFIAAVEKTAEEIRKIQVI